MLMFSFYVNVDFPNFLRKIQSIKFKQEIDQSFQIIVTLTSYSSEIKKKVKVTYGWTLQKVVQHYSLSFLDPFEYLALH